MARTVTLMFTDLSRLGLAVFAAALAFPSQAAHAQITVTRTDQISPRLREYGITTPALAGETNLRVLLPAGYNANPARRYPTLYLLHGCCDFDVPGSRAWTTHGDAEKLTESLDLIVVMPDAGRGGFYSDWYRPGPPRWETYHVAELIPWVDRTLRTIAAREGRVVAGLSMGGFGTMSYAARHPDLFVAAASFSGAVNNMEPGVGDAAEALSAQDGGAPGDVWGPRATEEIRWRAHNPVDLAENLRPLDLTVRTGNGQPGGEYGGGPDPVEMGVHSQSVTFHERLVALAKPHVWEDYGPGAHAWEYWAADLAKTLPSLVAALANPPAAPAPVVHTAVEPTYEVYGWRVEMTRPALEFSRLEGATAAGFVLEGSGSAIVTTPPLFVPESTATVSTSFGLTASAQLKVGSDGRLKVPVALGEGNPVQQYAPGAGTRFTRAQMQIAAPLAAVRPSCRNRGVVRVRVPRALRAVRVTIGGRRLRVRRRIVLVDVRGNAAGTVRVVIRGRTRTGKPVRRVRRVAVCA